MVIAIDGPAASGKSTVARILAKKLGYQYMDTGAMYRALTWKVLENKIDPSDVSALSSMARGSKIFFSGDRSEGVSRAIFIDDVDVSRKIRSRRVENTVSLVAKVPEVRQAMVKQQQALAQEGDFVVEGRDIGTVVFPDAQVKIFITASTRERARRRQKDLQKLGHDVDLRTLEREIITRDKIDSTREASPLSRAQDAHVIDTTDKTVRQVLGEVLAFCPREER